MKKKVKIFLIILSVILAIVLALGVTFVVLHELGKNQFHKGDTNISVDSAETNNDEDTVTINGKSYTRNKNIITVLFMGIDKNDVTVGRGYGSNGQADCVFLAAIDTVKRRLTIIPISREVMVDVNTYTTEGAYSGTQNMQLCLAYAYGNSPKESSENVITSVKRLLFGINIGSYITVDMNGIGKFTELIGGIELQSIEAVKIEGADVAVGQKLKLSGKSAFDYIHYRGDDLEANHRRMQRQKQFLTALANKSGNLILDNFSRLGAYYREMSPYFHSDITLSQITYLVSSCITSNMGDMMEYKIIDGTLSMGEEWVEFYADENSVLDAVLGTFYIEQ